MTQRNVSELGRSGAVGWRGVGVAFAIALAGLAGGCTGSLGDPDPRGFLDGLLSGGQGGGADDDGTGSGAGSSAEVQVVPELAFPRLSHGQWENTIQSLFQLDAPTGLSDSFYPDPGASGTFDNNTDAKSVVPELWADYQRAAEEIAVMVSSDPALLAKTVDPGAPTDEAAFVEHFVRRAYRRPLTDEERARYLTLFDKASEVDEAGADPFIAGVRLVIEAALQSPHFIYRVELGGEPDDEGLRTLSGWELAAKLSYTLWNDMPDDSLFDAAESGRLADKDSIGAEIDRLLASPRAKANLASFVDQLFQAKQFEGITKNEDVFPGWDPETAADLREELTRFASKVIFDDDGGLEQLLLSRTTFVNARVARIYGLEGDFSDDAFTEVELDPSQRAGLLTLAGFLAWKGSKAGTQDTILRGVFVNRNILCTVLGDPPPEAAGKVPTDGATNRDKVDNLTGLGTCGEGCHSSYINPVGFALEHYDGFGRWQGNEGGVAVDASAELLFREGPVAIDGAVELSEAIAASEEAHKCFAKHWIELEYGRDVDREADQGLVAQIAELSRGGASVRTIVRELLTSKAFLKKAVTQ